MTEKIAASHNLETPMEGRISRQVKHMPFATQINIRAESQHLHMLDIVTADRPGLLAKVAFLFLQLDIDLHNAKINTLGNRVEDSFLISAKQQQALNAAQIDALCDSFCKL